MADALLRASETKTADFDNTSNMGVWTNLYTGLHIDSQLDNEEPMATNTIVSAYIRVSTDKQDEKMQKTYITAQLKLAGIDPNQVEWFAETISASKKERLQDRKEGKKLLALIDTGQVKQVFCYKLDRLFRSQRAAHAFVAVCQEMHTDVISMDTPSGLLTDEGFLLYSINFMMAEMEVRRLGKRTTHGMDETRKNGGVTTSAVFGWDIMEVLDAEGNPLIGSNDKVVKKAVPNWQEQAVINWMQTQVINGKSNSWIARELNGIGLKGKNGGKWQSNSVKRVLAAKQHSQIVNFTPPKRMMKWPFADLRKKQT